MSGYRESSYDPTHYERIGTPLRPFNWVQWTGVGIELVGLLGYAYFVAVRTGWARDPGFNTMMVGLPLLVVGQSLIFSRREEPIDPAPELAAARKRWLTITVAVCAVILGAAVIIDFVRS